MNPTAGNSTTIRSPATEKPQTPSTPKTIHQPAKAGNQLRELAMDCLFYLERRYKKMANPTKKNRWAAAQSGEHTLIDDEGVDPDVAAINAAAAQKAAEEAVALKAAGDRYSGNLQDTPGSRVKRYGRYVSI